MCAQHGDSNKAHVVHKESGAQGGKTRVFPGTSELLAARGSGGGQQNPHPGLKPLKLGAPDLSNHLDFREARKICSASVKLPFLYLWPSYLSYI